MSRGSAHLRSLTSLRFFAAALVLAYHAGNWSTPDVTQPYVLLEFGTLGVSFFFVLSGMVLVWSGHEDDRAGTFYRRRFARVWPLHALTLMFALGLAVLGLIELRGPLSAAPVNLALLHAWSFDPDVAYGFNSVSWSLSAEAFFYAVFPIAVLAARRAGPWPTVAFGVAWLVLGGVTIEALDMLPLSSTFPAYRLGEFLVGIGLGLLARRGLVPRVSIRFAIVAALVSYALLMMLNQLTSGQITPRPWLIGLVALPSIILLLLAFARRDLEGLTGWLTNPTMVRLGQWSFALYMAHELMLRALQPVLIAHAWAIVPAMLAAVAATGVLHEGFERPASRILRGKDRPAVELEPADR